MTDDKKPDPDLRLDDRKFGSVDVNHFDKDGCGPFRCSLQVRANCHPSKHFPSDRIYVGAWAPEPGRMDFGGMCLTIADARELRRQLGEAIAAVSKAAPHLLLEVVGESTDPDPPRGERVEFAKPITGQACASCGVLGERHAGARHPFAVAIADSSKEPS